MSTCRELEFTSVQFSSSAVNTALVTPPPVRERSIVMSVSVYLSVCVCLSVRDHILGTTCTLYDLHQIFVYVAYGHGSVLIWRRSGTLCTSGFMDDAIFAHRPRLLDVAAQLKHSAHAALRLAINCAN